MLASTKDKATKSKSKNKSTSLGSKKQSSKQKSISQKKNLSKTVKASQPTIYTSGSTNIKRRWDDLFFICLFKSNDYLTVEYDPSIY